jgi:hypothetical protein
MACKSVKQWVGVALLLPALLHGNSLGTESEKEWPGPSAAPQAAQPEDSPEEEPFPAWLLLITEKIAFEHGLSPRLVKSIILTESNGNARKVSPKGAKGLMQLMPVVMQHYQVKDPYDPVTNIRAGVQYLVNLLEEFSGDLTLALAAYNAGPTAVRKYRGIPPFPETQAFVLRVSDLFHSLEPRPRVVYLAMNSGGGDPAAIEIRPTSFRGTPRSLLLWLKKMRAEVSEVQIQ